MNIEHALIDDVLQYLAQKKIFPSPIKFSNTNDLAQVKVYFIRNKNTNKEKIRQLQICRQNGHFFQWII